MENSLEINNIRKKIVTSGWARLIKNIKIKGLHSFNNIIEFKFPICAIVGENGTGKSTILKLCACAYKNEDKTKTFYPTSFFPETIWEQVRNVNVDYEISLGDPPLKKYTLKKIEERWRGDITNRPTNNVFYFDLSRTQPTESMIGYSKIAKRTNTEVGSRDLSNEAISRISSIMAKPYSSGRYVTTDAYIQKEIGILKFPTIGDVSQFHQGMGESIVTNILSVVENAPNYSLIIIDEIETSLHPLSQRRLIRQLLYLTRIKTLQIIISTHSPYILSELPEESRILLTKTNQGVEIIYAPTVNLCLTKIDDELHPDLDIVVEDEESKIIVSEIIRNYGKEINPRIRIIPAGPVNIVKNLAKLSKSGRIPYNILGIIDADQDEEDKDLYKLFGSKAPERQIIEDVYSNSLSLKILSDRLSLNEKVVKEEIEKIIVIPNHHEWLTRLENRFNLPNSILWTILVSIWVANCLPKEKGGELIKLIQNNLIKQ